MRFLTVNFEILLMGIFLDFLKKQLQDSFVLQFSYTYKSSCTLIFNLLLNFLFLNGNSINKSNIYLHRGVKHLPVTITIVRESFTSLRAEP